MVIIIWLVLSVDITYTIEWALKKNKKKQYNKHLINLEILVFTRKSPISTLPYWPCYLSVNMSRS